LGHSSCGCWALVINDNGILEFKLRCEKFSFKSGYSMYLETDTHIAVTYNGLDISFYINGGLANRMTTPLAMSCGGDLDIGRYSSTDSEKFLGKISFV